MITSVLIHDLNLCLLSLPVSHALQAVQSRRIVSHPWSVSIQSLSLFTSSDCHKYVQELSLVERMLSDHLSVTQRRSDHPMDHLRSPRITSSRHERGPLSASMCQSAPPLPLVCADRSRISNETDEMWSAGAGRSGTPSLGGLTEPGV